MSSTSTPESPYDILGVSRAAPESVIRAAYKARIRETHPDAGGDPAQAQAVNDAFAILSDPDRRRAYDRDNPEASTPEHEPPVQDAPSPAAAEEPERVALRGDMQPPRSWWRSPFVYVPALAIVAGAVLFANAATTGVLVLVVAAVSLYFGVKHARRREDRGWDTYAGDIVLTSANAQPGVSLYRVENISGNGPRAQVLLTRPEDGARVSDEVWTQGVPGASMRPGSYIALPDNSDLPLFCASGDGMARALRLRGRGGHA